METDNKNPSREMAYQQLTDLRIFCVIMEEIDTRALIDGPENAIEALRDYIPCIRTRIREIDHNLAFASLSCRIPEDN